MRGKREERAVAVRCAVELNTFNILLTWYIAWLERSLQRSEQLVQYLNLCNNHYTYLLAHIPQIHEKNEIIYTLFENDRLLPSASHSCVVRLVIQKVSFDFFFHYVLTSLYYKYNDSSTFVMLWTFFIFMSCYNRVWGRYINNVPCSLWLTTGTKITLNLGTIKKNDSCINQKYGLIRSLKV